MSPTARCCEVEILVTVASVAVEFVAALASCEAAEEINGPPVTPGASETAFSLGAELEFLLECGSEAIAASESEVTFKAIEVIKFATMQVPFSLLHPECVCACGYGCRYGLIIVIVVVVVIVFVFVLHGPLWLRYSFIFLLVIVYLCLPM